MIGSTVYLSEYREGQRFLEVWRGDRMVALVAVEEDAPYQLGEAYQIDEAMNPTPWPMEDCALCGPDREAGANDCEACDELAPVCSDCGREYVHASGCPRAVSLDIARALVEIDGLGDEAGVSAVFDRLGDIDS